MVKKEIIDKTENKNTVTYVLLHKDDSKKSQSQSYHGWAYQRG